MSKEKSKQEKPEVVENAPVIMEDNIDASVNKETRLDTREAELNIFAENLEEKEKSLAERETAVEQREKDIEQREKALAKSTSSQDTPGLEFTFKGERKKFSDEAPKLIRFDGEVWTQEELSKNEELIAELIAYDSSLIENVKI